MLRFSVRECLGKTAALFLATSMFAPLLAHAETYPDKPIRIISIHPTGIATDLLARAIAPRLGELLGQSVVVENRPGANGIIATGVVAKSPPDGYTALITSGSHIANSELKKDLPFDPIKDFAPIINLGVSSGLTLASNQPVSSVAELLKMGAQRPLSYAVNGPGNTTHTSALMLEAASKVKMSMVSYTTNAFINDVMSKNVDMTFVGTNVVEPLVSAGQLKALATTGTARSKLLPNVPTLLELGYPIDVTGYFGLLFPAGTPDDRVKKVNEAAAEALKSPAVKSFMDNSDLTPKGGSPAEFKADLEADRVIQSKLMKDLGLAP